MRTGLLAVAALALSGCSGGTMFDTPPHQADAYETVHAFYRPVVAHAVQGFLGVSSALIEISELRRSIPPQPGDWATCARAWKGGQLFYVTVFIRGRTVFETRRSIVIDRCEHEQFSVIPSNPL
jgi:hypothetical protein